MGTHRVTEIIEHFIGLLRLDELLVKSHTEYDGEAGPDSEIVSVSYGSFYSKAHGDEDAAIKSSGVKFASPGKSADISPQGPDISPDAELDSNLDSPRLFVPENALDLPPASAAASGNGGQGKVDDIRLLYEDGGDDRVINVHQMTDSLDIDTVGSPIDGLSAAARVAQGKADLAALELQADTVLQPEAANPGAIGSVAEARVYGTGLKEGGQAGSDGATVTTRLAIEGSPDTIDGEQEAGDLTDKNAGNTSVDTTPVATERLSTTEDDGQLPEPDQGTSEDGVELAAILSQSDQGQQASENTISASEPDTGNSEDDSPEGDPAEDKQAVAALIIPDAPIEDTSEEVSAPAGKSAVANPAENPSATNPDSDDETPDTEETPQTPVQMSPAATVGAEPTDAASGQQPANQHETGEEPAVSLGEAVSSDETQPAVAAPVGGTTDPEPEITPQALVNTQADDEPGEGDGDDEPANDGAGGDADGGAETTVTTVYTTGSATEALAGDDEPLPELEAAIVAALGGNSLANVAGLYNANEAFQSQIILGDKITNTVIVQKNLASDGDTVVISGSGPLSEVVTGENSIGNFFQSKTIYYDQPVIYDGTYNTFSKFVNVDYVEGDYFDIDEVTQENFLVDSDTYVNFSMFGAGSSILGANELLNWAKISIADAAYDLVVILGNRIEYNYISQTNKIVDTDTMNLTYQTSNEPSASVTVNSGGNVLENNAQLILVTNSYGPQAVTDPLLDLVSAIHHKDEYLDSDLNNLSASFKLGSTIDNILFVTGDYYSMQSIVQENELVDSDTLVGAVSNLPALSLGDGANGNLNDNGSYEVTAGENQVSNDAVIVDAAGVFGQTFVGGYIYEDTMIYQADLLEDSDTLVASGFVPGASQEVTEVADLSPNDVTTSSVTSPNAPTPITMPPVNGTDNDNDFAGKLADILAPDILGGVLS